MEIYLRNLEFTGSNFYKRHYKEAVSITVREDTKTERRTGSNQIGRRDAKLIPMVITV